MSAAEFAEWQAYSMIEPFGSRRADQRAWLGVAALTNIHRSEKSKPIDLASVLPEWRPPPEPMTDEQIWRTLEAQFQTFMNR